MRTISNFLEKLKNWKDNLKTYTYAFNDYDCEIADIFKQINRGQIEDRKFLDTWRKILNNSFFEIYHPFLNNIKIRAVANRLIADSSIYGNYIFLIDKKNQHPVLLVQFYGIADCIITPDGIYFTGLFELSRNGIWNNWARWCMLFNLIPSVKNITTQELVYQKRQICLLLNNPRPWHHFDDDLYWFYSLKLKSDIANIPSFFLPKSFGNRIVDFQNKVCIAPRIYVTSNPEFYKNQIQIRKLIYNEVVEENQLPKFSNYDLVLWIGLAGEKRSWIEQMEGIPKIIKELQKYFTNMKIFLDGMTNLEGAKEYFSSNILFLQNLKQKIQQIIQNNILCDIEILAGLSYREKIIICSQIDIYVGDAGTTAFIPVMICNKPAVLIGVKEQRNLYKNTNARMIDDKFCQEIDLNKSAHVRSYHAIWEGVFNLLADEIQNIKKIKINLIDINDINNKTENSTLIQEKQKLEEANKSLLSMDIKKKNLEIKNLEQSNILKQFKIKEVQHSIQLKELQIKKIEKDLQKLL
ncbi:TPA: hypothetical protein RZK50_001599 [Campylobacter coli]|nr:hypothetical protein [Campylobacter coli]